MASKLKGVGPDEHSKHSAVEPDEHSKHSLIEEDDVEGHSMLISPTVGRDLAKARSADLDRAVRGKNHEAEAKRVFRR
jgi:hypothetical protein